MTAKPLVKVSAGAYVVSLVYFRLEDVDVVRHQRPQLTPEIVKGLDH